MVLSPKALLDKIRPELENPYMMEFQEIIGNPNVTFLLLTFGVYGMIFEAANPGGILPGAFGVICFILGIFGLNMLPINYTGLGLMGLGVSFITAEAFVPSFGALGIGGAIAFAIGGSMLVDETVYGSGVSWWIIGATTLATIGIILLVMKMFLESRRRPVSTGIEALKGASGEIVHWSKNHVEVLASGTRWKASCTKDYNFKKGDKINIVDIDKLCLIIEPENTHKGD